VPAPAGKAGSPAKPGKKVVDEPAEMEEPAAESDDPFSDERLPERDVDSYSHSYS
jgi:hypothetical protein